MQLNKTAYLNGLIPAILLLTAQAQLANLTADTRLHIISAVACLARAYDVSHMSSLIHNTSVIQPSDRLGR